MNAWALWTIAGHRYAAYTADAFAIEVVPHHKGGYSWRVVNEQTDSKVEGAPEGFDATMEDAMRHSEGAFREWLAVAQERAAVVAWLRAECGSPGHEDRFCAYCNVRRNIAADIERGEHRREKKP